MTFRAARSLGPAEPHVRKDMAQHGIARGDSLQHIWRAVTILNPGAMDLEPYEQFGRIGTNVALAALDLFSGVISSNPATFCGFYILTSDDPGCPMGVSALGKARGFDRFVVHLIKQVLHCAQRRGSRGR